MNRKELSFRGIWEAFVTAFADSALEAVDLAAHWRVANSCFSFPATKDRDDPEDWLQVSQDDLDREMKV